MKKETIEEIEEEIEQEFTYIIREKMTNREFWSWVENWLDIETIMDIAETWEIEEKRETIAEFKNKELI